MPLCHQWKVDNYFFNEFMEFLRRWEVHTYKEMLFLKAIRKTEITAVGIRRADHVTPFYPQKLALTSPTSGGCSVGIVRWRTKAAELFRKVVYARYDASCFVQWMDILGGRGVEPTVTITGLLTWGLIRFPFRRITVEVFLGNICSPREREGEESWGW
jgi:hypothetical protein